MKKVFLDCGGNYGQSIDRFKRTSLYSPDFIIYSFEPNPITNVAYKNRQDIIFSDKAVWINDSTINFYISKRHKYVGSSLMAEKTSGHIDLEHPIVVQTLDFSKWLIDNFDKKDYILLKMDIEGAEYDVLEKMIKDGSINYINKMFIEFHSDKMVIEKDRHAKLINAISQIEGLELLSQLSDYIMESKKR